MSRKTKQLTPAEKYYKEVIGASEEESHTESSTAEESYDKELDNYRHDSFCTSSSEEVQESEQEEISDTSEEEEDADEVEEVIAEFFSWAKKRIGCKRVPESLQTFIYGYDESLLVEPEVSFEEILQEWYRYQRDGKDDDESTESEVESE